jgi:IclR family acetate operon transcriptional repressor
MSSVKQVQSVRNACTVIEAVAEHQPIGVSELARLTGVDKSAVHRLAVTLHAAGWLESSGDGRWSVAATLGVVLRRSAVDALVASARRFLVEGRDRSGETAMVVVPDRRRLVIVDVADSPQSLRVTAPLGAEMPAPRSSALRALAAHLPDDELASWREVDPGLDDGLLAGVRQRGWAENDAELIAESRAVGAALLDADGRPLGSLVLWGPSTRFDHDRLAELGPVVAELAERWRRRAG